MFVDFQGTVHLHPIWTLVTLVFMAERVVSVRERGPLQMLFASVLVIEMAFDFTCRHPGRGVLATP